MARRLRKDFGVFASWIANLPEPPPLRRVSVRRDHDLIREMVETREPGSRADPVPIAFEADARAALKCLRKATKDLKALIAHVRRAMRLPDGSPAYVTAEDNAPPALPAEPV